MYNSVFTVGQIKKIIAESSNEFKPVLGKNVERDNKTNNDKAYKESEKKLTSKGSKNSSKQLPDKTDFNATLLDYNPRVEPDKAWKDKVQAQAKGFTSTMEEKNGIEKGGAEFDKEGKIFKQFTNANKKRQEEREALGTSGLQSKEMPKRLKGTMTESIKPKAKRLVFKHTKFLTEAQMLARIPEDYKVDGQKIYMQDASDNEYIVECVKGNQTGVVETNIVSYTNRSKINEQYNRIHELFNYDTRSTSGKSTPNTMSRENSEFNTLMENRTK